MNRNGKRFFALFLLLLMLLALTPSALAEPEDTARPEAQDAVPEEAEQPADADSLTADESEEAADEPEEPSDEPEEAADEPEEPSDEPEEAADEPLEEISEDRQETVESGTCGDRLTWTFDDSTGKLTISGTGAMYSYNMEPADSRAPWYSYRYKIHSIEIKSGVTSIGSYAFYYAKATSITVPNTVTTIESNAFQDCRSLESFTIPSSITTIPAFAFNGCSALSALTIPSNVTTIENYAFSGCSALTAMTIPETVTSVGFGLFSNCSSLTSVSLPGSMTTIGTNFFAGCTALTSVTIPDSVTSIGQSAFRSCYSLTSLTIPESVRSIEQGAFSYCRGLTSLSIPKKVTRIDVYAFSGCTGLKEFSVSPDNPIYCSVDGVIFSKDLKKLVAFPVGSETAIYAIPSGTTTIGKSAFSGRTAYLSVTVPDGITTVEMSAFSECTGLHEIVLPNSVTSLAGSVFQNCSNLSSVVLPDQIPSLGQSLFQNCTSLASVTIPESVTMIGFKAFGECTSLSTVTFSGDAPTTMNAQCFSGVTATAYYPADNATWTEDVRKDYGGTITWVAVGEPPAPEFAAKIFSMSGTFGNSYILHYVVYVDSTVVSDFDSLTFSVKVETDQPRTEVATEAAFRDSNVACWRFTRKGEPVTNTDFVCYEMDVKLFAKQLDQPVYLEISEGETPLNIRGYQYSAGGIIGQIGTKIGHSLTDYVNLLSKVETAKAALWEDLRDKMAAYAAAMRAVA